MKSRYSFLIFLISFIFLDAKEESLIKIPLKVVNSTFEKYPIPRNISFTVEKEEKVKTIFGTRIRRLQQEINGTVNITDSTLFAAEVVIGGQIFDVILDTGSVNLWVPLINSSDDHEIDRHYIPSKTAKKTSEKFEIKYGTGSTKGYYYIEDIRFITEIPYRIKFGAASETNFNVKGAHGIMGLAKKYKENDYSPIWTLYAKHDIATRSFSFKYSDTGLVDMYLGTEHNDFKNTNQTAQCTLLDKSSYDKLLWTCKLHSFGLISKNNKINSTVDFGYNFLFDTGTNTMILPYFLLEKLTRNLDLRNFNCKEGTTKNGIQIICEDFYSLPNVVLEVGNYYLILNDQMYNEMYVNDIKYYVLNVIFEKELIISIIGQPFFTLFHTRFDYEEKVLKFYSDDPDAIKPAINDMKNNDAQYLAGDVLSEEDWLNNHKKAIVCVAIGIAAVAIVCFIRHICSKTCFRHKSSKKI